MLLLLFVMIDQDAEIQAWLQNISNSPKPEPPVPQKEQVPRKKVMASIGSALSSEECEQVSQGM